MKTAVVNGAAISREAVQFELERLARFYSSHGFSGDEIKKSLPELREKALEQAIGAKLLLDRAGELDIPVSGAELDAEVAKVVEQVGGVADFKKALDAQGVDEAEFRKELEKGAKVNKLVAQACAGADEPSEEDVAAFYESHKSDYAPRTIVDAHDEIRDLLRHQARGKAMDAFVAELREKAVVEYVDVPSAAHGCDCGRGHGQDGCGCGCGH